MKRTTLLARFAYIKEIAIFIRDIAKNDAVITTGGAF